MRNRSHRARLVVVGVVGLSLLATAAVAAAWASSRSARELTTYSHRGLVQPSARTAGTTPADVLASIVDKVNDPSVISATLGGPPAGLHESDDPSVPNSPSFTNSLWLYATVKSTGSTPAETTKPIWVGNLITGALRDALFEGSQTALRSSVVSLVLPTGSEITSAGGGIGAVTPGQTFSSGSDSQIEAQIDSAAQSAGVRMDSISIVHADQPAPAVVVTAPDPQGAAANPDGLLTALFGPPGTYEGEYLEVRAPDGSVVFVQGSAFRTGVGQRWVNPAYGGANDSPAPDAG